MSKFIFIFALICSTGWAKPANTDFEIVLKFSTNLKYSEKHTLARKNKKILKDGLILPSEKIVLAKSNISFLVNSTNREVSIKCPEGTYEFQVKRDGKTKNEKGCTNSKRFGELMTVFKSI